MKKDNINNSRNYFLLLIKILISIFILKTFLSFSGFEYIKLAGTLKMINIQMVVSLIFISFITNILLPVYRFQKMLNLFSIFPKYKDVFIAYAADCFMIFFVPLRISNLLRYYRFKPNISAKSLSSLFFLENLTILFSYLIISALGFFIISKYYLLIILIGFLMIIGYIFMRVINICNIKNIKRYFGILNISIICALLNVLIFYFVSISLSQTIPFAKLLFCIPLVIIFSKMPLFFSGIGIREYSLAYFLTSISKPEIFALSATYFTIDFFVPALFGAFFIRKFLKSLK